MSPLLDLPPFQGQVFTYGGPGYEEAREQYATSSKPAEEMSPGAIIFPNPANPDADVIAAVNYARQKGIAIAIRTGGHQYSGSSSTTSQNLQLDLSNAYRDFDWNDKSGELRVGISYSLGQLDTALGALHLFVPHGQCTHVHVGGHAHSGGYGLPGRGFGLFSDHIVAIRVITADGQIRQIRRGATGDDGDLFYAVLGGSPGNYGVLTEITLKPHRDSDYPNSRGFKAFTFYRTSAFRKLLDIKARMASDRNLPPDFDFCITVINGGKQVLDNYGFTVSDLEFSQKTDAFNRKADESKAASEAAAAASSERGLAPASFIFNEKWHADVMIIVWAQWANLGGRDQDIDALSKQYFDDINGALWFQIPGVGGFKETPMPLSSLNANWVFKIRREFEYPYIKRCYVTSNQFDLAAQHWPEATIRQVEAILERKPDLRVSVQIQNYGGTHSRYALNDPNNETSYSWRRDATVVHVIDGFYNPEGEPINGQTTEEWVKAWQLENDKILKGPSGVMGVDRRVLWGSYSITDAEQYMNVSWPFYYESRAMYDRLIAIKNRVDPTGVFTPNGFCVGQSPPAP